MRKLLLVFSCALLLVSCSPEVLFQYELSVYKISAKDIKVKLVNIPSDYDKIKIEEYSFLYNQIYESKVIMPESRYIGSGNATKYVIYKEIYKPIN